MNHEKGAPATAEAKSVATTSASGLTEQQAKAALSRDGLNALPETSESPVRRMLSKFWAPVPCLLEAAVVLQLVLHKFSEAAVIGGLLIFNAALAFAQESRAKATLSALKSRLAFNTSVRREGVWKIIPTDQVVCGDLVKLSLGGVVPADVHLLDGNVTLDQSMLTGESLPVEAASGADTFAGALIRRGEATAQVTSTGANTKFGRTADLVGKAHPKSSQQEAVLCVVRNLAIFNSLVIAFICTYAIAKHLPWRDIVPLLLTSILAAIPVALPATFTLAAALGARALAKVGVLPTRLSAVDEAATIDVLCSDKTGTLTRNELSIASIKPLQGTDEGYLLGMAALASSDGGQDAVDAAIRSAWSQRAAVKLPTLVRFEPFDPAKKTSSATATGENNEKLTIVKGAVASVLALTGPSPEGDALADQLTAQGSRVLAVGAGSPGAMKLLGLIALSDPPREDSRSLISELNSLGVITVMVTGDAPATATVVAREVGIASSMSPGGPLREGLTPQDFSIYAGILPEGKFDLVKVFQKSGSRVAMCGDGANDSPALRQAQCGIAVCTATDVAKSAAGIVLTEPGLVGIVSAIKEGRSIFQRIQTYTLNSVIKKITQVLLLAVGLIMTGHAILTPMLMVIVMITGDFLAMSLTTDHVNPSPVPNAWKIGRITAAGSIFGFLLLAFCSSVLAYGHFQQHLALGTLRTMTAAALVFGSQATLYPIRDRRHWWGSRPSMWLIGSSVLDVGVISYLSLNGIAMERLPIGLLAEELAAAFAFALILNAIKIPIFRWIDLS